MTTADPTRDGRQTLPSQGMADALLRFFRRSWIWLVLLAASALVVREALRASGAPIAVETAVVREASIEESVQATGLLRPEHIVHILPEIDGRVAQILVAEGDPVEAGDPLLQLEDEHLRLRLREAEAALQRSAHEVCRAELELDHRNERLDRLSAVEDAVSRRELGEARAAVELARAELDVLRSEHGAAEIRRDAALLELRRAVVQAPSGGVVASIDIQPGDLVGPSWAAQRRWAARIIDPTSWIATVRVDEFAVGGIQPQAPAHVRVLGLDASPVEGRVRRVGIVPPADRTGDAVLYEVDIRLVTPPANLRTGMSVEADILRNTRSGKTAVPVEALRQRAAGGEEVVCIRDGRAATVAVEVVARDARLALVRGEIAAGETVVRGPRGVLDRLTAGSPLRSRTQAQETARAVD